MDTTAAFQKVLNQISDIETDYRVLLIVHRDALADAGLLEKYIANRGDKFDEDGRDHITLLQARLLGLLKSGMPQTLHPLYVETMRKPDVLAGVRVTCRVCNGGGCREKNSDCENGTEVLPF